MTGPGGANGAPWAAGANAPAKTKSQTVAANVPAATARLPGLRCAPVPVVVAWRYAAVSATS